MATSAKNTSSLSVGRTNDPERTMAEILAVATSEFAAKGLAGARIDEIAAATRTSKRMIYYYFGSKEGLYVAVLESAYSRMRKYLAQSQGIQKLNGSALQTIQEVYDRGVAQGVFRKGLTPLEIHSAISALTFFNVSNRHTFGLIFKGKSAQGKAQTLKKSQVVELINGYVRL